MDSPSFRIYYGDGTTYKGDPFHAPAMNVQLIVAEWHAERGWRIVQGKDYYLWREDSGWYAADIGGLFDYLATHAGPQKVLLGRTIHDEVYQEISKRARKELLG